MVPVLGVEESHRSGLRYHEETTGSIKVCGGWGEA